MTVNGWIQIAIFAALVVAVVVPLGGYMARVFAGERIPLSPATSRGISTQFVGSWDSGNSVAFQFCAVCGSTFCEVEGFAT